MPFRYHCFDYRLNRFISRICHHCLQSQKELRLASTILPKHSGLVGKPFEMIKFRTMKDGMLGLGVPSKVYYSMAADKLLFCIMDKESEIYTMVKNHNIGWVVEQDDTKELAQKLDQAVKDFRNINLNSSRKILIEKYSDRISINKLIKIIRSYI